MAKQLQIRGGTTAQHSTFTGAVREITVDTDKDTLVVHDGTTAGGFPLAKESVVNGIDTRLGTAETGLSGHIADTDNPHGVTKVQVGLSNVDNTSDANKPISTATQSALDTKVDKVVGKQLSTEDYTTTEKTKLSGIEAGATADQIASEVPYNNSASGIVAVNVQAAIDEVEARVGAIEDNTTLAEYGITDAYTKTELNSIHILRADKYLAAQAVANMVYTDGKLSKVQYNNATDVDYEILTYGVDGKLDNVAHYVSGALAGNTVLSYTSGKLVSAIYTGV